MRGGERYDSRLGDEDTGGFPACAGVSAVYLQAAREAKRFPRRHGGERYQDRTAADKISPYIQEVIVRDEFAHDGLLRFPSTLHGAINAVCRKCFPKN